MSLVEEERERSNLALKSVKKRRRKVLDGDSLRCGGSRHGGSSGV